VAPQRLTWVVTGVVSVAWLAALAIGAIQHDWTALTITTPVMIPLASYAFGIKWVTRQINGRMNDGRSTDTR
jgi:hypothetical protein